MRRAWIGGRRHWTAWLTQCRYGLFYATAATVIPVLFLAMAVQGTGYQNFLELAVRARRSATSRGPTCRHPVLANARLIRPGSIIGLAALIPAYAGAGEIASALARYVQRAGTVVTALAVSAIIVLTIANAAGPSAALFRAIAETDSLADNPEPTQPAKRRSRGPWTPAPRTRRASRAGSPPETRHNRPAHKRNPRADPKNGSQTRGR